MSDMKMAIFTLLLRLNLNLSLTNDFLMGKLSHAYNGDFFLRPKFYFSFIRLLSLQVDIYIFLFFSLFFSPRKQKIMASADVWKLHYYVLDVSVRSVFALERFNISFRDNRNWQIQIHNLWAPSGKNLAIFLYLENRLCNLKVI